jgi:HPt (histidine-containing phosphotransfer) domain-containing protein
MRQSASGAKGESAQLNGKALSLLDYAALDRLRGELNDDQGLCKVFVENFIAYLPTRSERLRRALTTGDVTAALDAVLGLKTSSQMVGAERLGELAFELERSIRLEAKADPARVLPRLAVTHLGPIVRCGRQTTYPLLKYLAKTV